MKAKFIVHKDIKRPELDKIIEIKSISWPYSGYRHHKWIQNNISDQDVHVLLYNEQNILIGYANLINIKVKINDQNLNGIGIGNVCTAQHGIGHGKFLVNIINEFVVKNEVIGLLFCRKKLLNFYMKMGWSIIDNLKIKSANLISSEINVLMYNFKNEVRRFQYDDKLF